MGNIMSKSIILSAVTLCIGIASIASAAPPPGTTGPTIDPAITNPATLPKGVRDKLPRPITCRPDLTISRIILTRSGPTRSVVTVSVEVKNIGTGSFVSDPRQAGVSAVLTNGNTNGRINLDLGSIGELSGSAARIYNGVSRTMPFDTFEFGGEVSANIGYDPDILLDGQPCNDDPVYANNSFAISNDRVRAWLGTTSNRLEVRR
jgi:hypothetical protein